MKVISGYMDNLRTSVLANVVFDGTGNVEMELCNEREGTNIVIPFSKMEWEDFVFFMHEFQTQIETEKGLLTFIHIPQHLRQYIGH